MKLRNVELSNFCQHKATKVEFCPGLNGIFGRNGAGKSNLLRGISYALTGSSPNFGDKKDDIRLGESKGYAQVEFSNGGEVGVIKRQLASSSSSLSFGPHKFTTASDVNDNIFDILGVSKDMLQRTIFVHQEDLDKILFERPAERSKALQRLFGTWRAEELRDLLYNEISDMPDISHAGKLEEIRNERQQLETERIATTEAELGQVNSELSTINEEELNEKLHKHAEAKRLERELVRFNEDDYNSKHAALETEIVALDTKVEECRQKINQAAPVIAELSSKRDQLISLRNKYARYMQLLTISQDLETQLSDEPPVEPAESKETLSSYRKKLEDLSSEVEIHRRFLSALENGNTCFYCYSIIKDANKRREIANALIAESLKKYEELSAKERTLREQWSVYSTHIAEYNQRMAGVLKQAKETAAELNALGAVREVTEKEIEDLNQKLIQLQRVLPDDLSSAVQERDLKQMELKTLEGRYKQQSAALDELKRARVNILGEDEYKRLYDQLNRVSDLKRRRSELTGVLHELARRLDDLSFKMQELAEKEKEYESTREFFDLISSARAVLHRDDLPKKAARAFQDILNVKLNEYLSMFDAPFTCNMGENLEFICQFSDGTIAAERLSGGERVILAISFRFAINDIFSSQLGLLVLDEPTRWLDNKNIQHLVKALEDAKSIAKSGALQIILISHHEQLFEVCDKIIML